MSRCFVLSDTLSTVVNSRNDVLFVPHTNFAFNVLKVIHNGGLFSTVEKVEVAGSYMIKVNKSNTIKGASFKVSKISLISKPSCRVYENIKNLKLIHLRDPFVFYVISTSKGLMSIKAAIANGLGGEVVCKVII